ncbi:TATA-box binding protein-associated factor 9 [Cyanidioschyzon merolae strain 10D]|jgi:transcription initiation factor TFIID subunit 9B|uniref:TATA-box binding protein-associated factor 9 n=1 Tax=Cyanidioschyzon merolae (strain NIES-3377 / 10D) TaxID=280699 RepID=M1V9H8_CYAM1|nr:TATA-box binding protein-associated factor 9 [Cyanidioschyzon merolae strain 10D]BAM81529.1 TATA-box binding protein-associated factor 9 [Cyanidioschyzon merolae strain 10D]|eukprot:XP_005537565.1 TATA-box binding protein-associated factor 9 [Cyanidioschyzon merolae strain 10D]
MSKVEVAGAPLDARILASILSSMGIEEYDDRVIHQLLELLYRYVAEVLTDARDLSEHAHRGQGKVSRTGSGVSAAAAAGDMAEIDVNDVKLAIELKLQREFVQPPPREVQMLHARELNAVPLPVFRGDRDTVELPPEELQLTAPVFRVTAQKRKRELNKRALPVATDGGGYSTVLAVSDAVNQRVAIVTHAHSDTAGNLGDSPQTRMIESEPLAEEAFARASPSVDESSEHEEAMVTNSPEADPERTGEPSSAPTAAADAARAEPASRRSRRR